MSGAEVFGLKHAILFQRLQSAGQQRTGGRIEVDRRSDIDLAILIGETSGHIPCKATAERVDQQRSHIRLRRLGACQAQLGGARQRIGPDFGRRGAMVGARKPHQRLAPDLAAAARGAVQHDSLQPNA